MHILLLSGTQISAYHSPSTSPLPPTFSLLRAWPWPRNKGFFLITFLFTWNDLLSLNYHLNERRWYLSGRETIPM